MTIRSHPLITGVTIGNYEHRLGLFADDIAIFLRHLAQSLPTLIKLLDTFGSISGYKVNNTKSNIMFFRKTERDNPPLVNTFHNSPHGFTYLGIKITPDINDIVHTNYDPILKSVSESLKRWSELPISMIGRVNIIKMNILPKLLCKTFYSNLSLCSPLLIYSPN